MEYDQIEIKLAEKTKDGYKKYNEKIISTSYPVLGVSIPAIRKLAKSYAAIAEKVFDEFDPVSFEGVLFKGFLLSGMNAPFEALWNRTVRYLELADNWAHIDCFFSGYKGCKKYSPEFTKAFGSYVEDDRVFFRRAVAVFTMDYRLTDEGIDDALNTFHAIRAGDYYVDMAVAWGLATAFSKYFDKTLSFMSKNCFSAEIVKMTVGKCRDSFRLTQAQKEIIKQKLK